MFDEMRGWQKALLVALLGLVVTMCAVAVDSGQANDVAAKQKVIASQASAAVNRLAQAEKMVQDQARSYPIKYSVQFPQALDAARKTFANDGTVPTQLRRLEEVSSNHDWSTAYTILNNLNAAITKDVGTIDTILGPPNRTGKGWYDVLAGKVQEVDQGMVVKIGVEIDNAKSDLDHSPQKARCDSSDRLSYTRAYAKLAEVREQVKSAGLLAETRVDGMFDKPAAYDKAVEARNSVAAAIALAKEDASDADLAQSAITTAQAGIESARVYVLGSSYQQSQALQALDGAGSTLQLARKACHAEDFKGAITLANQALGQARNAQGIVATPTPTPRPTSTPEPRRYSDDDSTTIIIIGGGSPSSGRSNTTTSSPSSGKSGSSSTSPSTSPSSDKGGYRSSGSSTKPSDSGGYRSSGSSTKPSDSGGYRSSGSSSKPSSSGSSSRSSGKGGK